MIAYPCCFLSLIWANISLHSASNLIPEDWNREKSLYMRMISNYVLIRPFTKHSVATNEEQKSLHLITKTYIPDFGLERDFGLEACEHRLTSATSPWNNVQKFVCVRRPQLSLTPPQKNDSCILIWPVVTALKHLNQSFTCLTSWLLSRTQQQN